MALELDITPLNRAIASLEAAMAHAAASPDDLLRDGCIHRFEYTYELSHKMLKRYLSMASPSPDHIAGLSFPDLIRTGSEQGLLREGWPRWKAYRDARGTTSHTYDERKAREVAAVIPDFLDEAKFLAERLAEGVAK